MPNPRSFVSLGPWLVIGCLLVAVAVVVIGRNGQDAPRVPIQPEYQVDPSTEEAVAQFVQSHQDEAIQSLWLHDISLETKTFSHLKCLKGVHSLTLSGGWDGTPIGNNQKGWFLFKAPLSDDTIREIAQIKSLRSLTIWYGSISDSQKKMILQLNPKCEFHENLNKF